MTSSFRSKKEIVYDEIRSAILTGKYKPGSRLVIDELAIQLGVSQIPIREAMRQLEADGFVTIEPYVGATITETNAEFIFEVFALLESMEVISSRAACQNMNNDDIEQVKRIIKEMDSCLHNADEWARKNADLHLFICECAKTQLVMKMMKKVLDHWDRLRQQYLSGMPSNRLENAQKEHKLILDAMIKRDPDEVERIIREHNQNALASYIYYLQSAGHLTNIEDA